MEVTRELFSLRQAAILLGRVGYERLLKRLTVVHEIPVFMIGKRQAYDQAGIDLLRQALQEHDSRPTVSGRPKQWRKTVAAT